MNGKYIKFLSVLKSPQFLNMLDLILFLFFQGSSTCQEDWRGNSS